jgi:hypothetical protein
MEQNDAREGQLERRSLPMRTGISSLTILCLVLTVTPASGTILYNNGPAGPDIDAWTINNGYIVSDTFTLISSSTVNGFDFAAWEFPGDTVLTVDWSITSQENGGTMYGGGTASVTQQFISVNAYGYWEYEVSATGLNVGLSTGTYWLNLQNAVTSQGNPVYWDENSGMGCHSQGCPSQASESAVGTIPSESFDITGTSGGTTPEPSSIILFGSGILGIVGRLRQKLF